MAESATLQVPKDVIEPIIKEHVANAVAQALMGRDRLVAECVHAVLNVRVDSDGKQSHYTRDSSPTWLQWVMQQCVKEAVIESVREELAKHKDALKSAIVSDLKSQRGRLAKQLADSMIGALTDDSVLKYRLKVEFNDK